MNPLILIILSSVLISGCVVRPPWYHDDHGRDGDGYSRKRDDRDDHGRRGGRGDHRHDDHDDDD